MIVRPSNKLVIELAIGLSKWAGKNGFFARAMYVCPMASCSCTEPPRKYSALRGLWHKQIVSESSSDFGAQRTQGSTSIGLDALTKGPEN